MHSLTLKVRADELSWEILIERRITIIRGDSGNGKSTVVDYVSSPNPAVDIDFPMRIAVADYTT